MPRFIAAANASMCERTAARCARVVSESAPAAGGLAVAVVVPLVPVVAVGDGAVVSGPIRSEMIWSIAATSVLQLSFAALVAFAPASRSRVATCCFNLMIRELAEPVRVLGATASRASFAWRR